MNRKDHSNIYERSKLTVPIFSHRKTQKHTDSNIILFRHGVVNIVEPKGLCQSVCVEWPCPDWATGG